MDFFTALIEFIVSFFVELVAGGVLDAILNNLGLGG